MLEECTDIIIEHLYDLLEKIIKKSGTYCSPRLVPERDIQNYLKIHKKESLKVYIDILFWLMNNKQNPEEIKEFTSKIGEKITNIAESGYCEKEELTPESMNELMLYVNGLKEELTHESKMEFTNQSELDELRKNCSDKENKISELIGENEILKKQITQKNDNIQELEAKVKTLEEQIKQKDKNIQKLEAKVKTLKEQITQKDEEKSKFQVTLDEMKNNYEKIENEYTKNKKETKELKSNLNKIRQESEEQKNKYIKLLANKDEAYEKMKNMLKKNESDKKDLESKNKLYEEQNQKLINENNNMNKKIDEMKKSYKKIQKENNQLRNENEQKARRKTIDISIDQSYIANERTKSLKDEMDSLIEFKQDLTPRDTVINNEMGKILRLFHQLMTKFNQDVPKNFKIFIEDLLKSDGNERIKKIELYVNGCKKIQS